MPECGQWKPACLADGRGIEQYQPNRSFVEQELGGFDLTEDGLALAFVQKHGGDLKFCHHSKKWYVWTGTRWRVEVTCLAFDWARDVCRHLNVEGKSKLASAATAAAVERFAQADRRMAVTSEHWDWDHFLLGTQKVPLTSAPNPSAC
jgi:hypothetical protein